MHKTWYIIVNPVSGNGKSIKKIELIKKELYNNNMPFYLVFTEYIHHEKILVQEAIKQGYIKFISVGGDGTLHHIVNGIMLQNYVASNLIKVAVIPVGTGNDWVKTYNIPHNIKQNITIIKNEKTILQDIGKIQINNEKNTYYFNNIAGIGFDGFVVKRIKKIKKLGSFAYLLGSLSSFVTYKKSTMIISLSNKKISSEIFMISIGLCKYSGGGMRLTKFKDHKINWFDITIIKNITLIKLLFNIYKLFNGKIDDLREVESLREKHLSIKISSNQMPYIQADGELLGKGHINVEIIKNAIQFII